MASDSELSESIDSTESIETEDSEEEWGVIETEMTPYQDEPLADVDDGESNHSEEEVDIDGLTPAVLEQRYDGTVSVDSWLVTFFGSLRNCLSQTRITHAKGIVYDGRHICFCRCRCQRCNTDTLIGSLEFRCCREVTSASRMMVFDGSIEHIKEQRQNTLPLLFRILLAHIFLKNETCAGIN